MAKKLSALIVALLLILALPVSASANAAEPPGITIIVEDAPDDISLTLELAEEPEYGAHIQKAQKNWEVYFHLYYHWDSGTLDGAVIKVESYQKSFSCPLPEGAYSGYNNILTLNFETQTLTFGQRWWRQPLLTAVRVTVTFLIEGLIFFAFGFRSKRSWLVFFAVNLVTQGWLNYVINGSAFSGGYWLFGLYLAEFLIFIVETVIFPLATKELPKLRCLLYALSANITSLIAGLLLIRYLPF